MNNRREDAATQLGIAVCKQQNNSDVEGCIQQAYDGLEVDPDFGDGTGLEGGNYNWSYDGLKINDEQVNPAGFDDCIAGRCGSFNSMDFSHGDNSFHIDTSNVYGVLGVGALVHLFADVIGGTSGGVVEYLALTSSVALISGY